VVSGRELAGKRASQAQSVARLSSFSFLLGALAAAFNWACALKGDAEAFLHRRTRPLAMGILNSGAAVGALLAQ